MKPAAIKIDWLQCADIAYFSLASLVGQSNFEEDAWYIYEDVRRPEKNMLSTQEKEAFSPLLPLFKKYVPKSNTKVMNWFNAFKKGRPSIRTRTSSIIFTAAVSGLAFCFSIKRPLQTSVCMISLSNRSFHSFVSRRPKMQFFSSAFYFLLSCGEISSTKEIKKAFLILLSFIPLSFCFTVSFCAFSHPQRALRCSFRGFFSKAGEKSSSVVMVWL